MLELSIFKLFEMQCTHFVLMFVFFLSFLVEIPPDVGDIQSRLLDHRPIINAEIRYFVREFEVLDLMRPWGVPYILLLRQCFAHTHKVFIIQGQKCL